MYPVRRLVIRVFLNEQTERDRKPHGVWGGPKTSVGPGGARSLGRLLVGRAGVPDPSVVNWGFVMMVHRRLTFGKNMGRNGSEGSEANREGGAGGCGKGQGSPASR